MKRLILLVAFFSLVNNLFSQTGTSGIFIPSDLYSPFSSYRLLPDSLSNKKWSFNTFSGISTSIIGWKGGHATTFSAPIGIELNRRLNNNLYAFAALSAAPTYINFRSSFLNTDFNKTGFSNSFSAANKLNIFPKAEVGLKYVNDERTFEISGSMSVQRVPTYYYPVIPIAGSLRN